MQGIVVRLKDDNRLLDVHLQLYGYLTCPPDWGEVDYSSYHRLYYVYGGSGACCIDGIEHPLKTGHMYMFPVNKTYTLKHDGEDPLVCTYLHLYITPLIITPLIEIKVNEESPLDKAFDNLRLLIEQDYPVESIRAQVGVLMTFIGTTVPLEYLNNDLVQEAAKYIKEHYYEKLTNDMIAKELGYNTNYFIKIFRRHIGISPQLYVANYRLRIAIQLLLEEKSIELVTRMVGYEDSKSFARFFKRHLGVPPSKYKDYYTIRP